MSKSQKAMDHLWSFCKQRGFVYPCSEIYNGLANSYDYGPLGIQLKKNISDMWWRDFVSHRRDCVGLESSIILNPNVWRKSGHVDNFTDPLVECKQCHKRHRADKLVTAFSKEKVQGDTLSLEEINVYLSENLVSCPHCGVKSSFSASKTFNLMFQTNLGATNDDQSVAFLRPETAQGAYINFGNVLRSSGKNVPFGIGQSGKSFRNEISPSQFLFRTREFEQMELQYFCHPNDAEKWYKYWVQYCHSWLIKVGLNDLNIRERIHNEKELAHYALGTVDLEYKFPFGWGELWGIANRGDYDLKTHTKASGVNLNYTDPNTKEIFTPFVIEPAVGLNRLMMAILCDSLHVEQVNDDKGAPSDRTVLKLHQDLAPFRYAVLPLIKKQPLIDYANNIFDKLITKAPTDFSVQGTIGKRYRKNDEIGTPECITIDFETLEDHKVTIRNRDTMEQKRIHVNELLGKDK